MSRRTAQRLGLGRSRTVLRRRVGMASGGVAKIRVRLAKPARRAMHRTGMKSLRTTLKIVVSDDSGRSASLRRAAKLRR